MKSASTIKQNPVIDLQGGKREMPELPVKNVAEILTRTTGRSLMQNSRVTKSMIEAVLFVHPFAKGFDDDYASEIMDDLLNLSIGLEGQGRRDLIDLLQASGSVPDAYYAGNTGNARYQRTDASYVRYGDDA